MKNIWMTYLLLLISMFNPRVLSSTFAQSKAGFYPLSGSGRDVYNLNIAWRFYKGSVLKAQESNFDDSKWQVVNLPNGIELLGEEASGGVNYQGEVWYRKHFDAGNELKGKKVFLHFEAIMGKSKIWINGQLVSSHFGGYLPIVIDASKYLDYGKKNVIAVCADNSDDSTYAPGKQQSGLDFAYFGGIYRDCWLVVHNKLYISDPNFEKQVAGGGLFVHHSNVTKEHSITKFRLHVKNEYENVQKGKIIFNIKNKQGTLVAKSEKNYKISKFQSANIEESLTIQKPSLWSPDHPYLYDLEIQIVDNKGNCVDGFRQRLGVRSVEFRGNEGLWINGEQVKDKLVGVNRHQEFAIIGNALPNSLHWRDAKKMRDAGVRIIRGTHYPHDPAFLDACDELGIFVIGTTPGWQFWNKEPIFQQRIYDDIRNLVRRDRNHPSILFWEPVLNETDFPVEFAIKARQCVEEENPYAGGHYTAIDPGSKGSESYPINFSHPRNNTTVQTTSTYNAASIDPQKTYFTREFGDNVDDWAAHNSNSRVHRAWGEIPMLTQAQHYASPDYPFTSIEALYSSPQYHLGGTLWHAFDHQRGYHPQTFYGGIMDLFRQPKTSYYMFMAQRPAPVNKMLPAESGPMLFIANEMTPFSPKDITVYSNCDEVRLTVFQNGEQYHYKRSSSDLKMPSPIIMFKDAFDFMKLKALSRAGNQEKVYILAEGLIGGKVVVTEKKMPSLRPTKIRLRIDDQGKSLRADGSDIVVLVAEVVDNNGNIKRLNNFKIRFSVEGEGRLLGDEVTATNPIDANWGTAPILVKATNKAGSIRVQAEVLATGINTVEPAEIIFKSVSATDKFLYDDQELAIANRTVSNEGKTPMFKDDRTDNLETELKILKKKLNELQLREVEKQQEQFGEKR